MSRWRETESGIPVSRALTRSLAPVRKAARREGTRVFLVGGAVRDLLLRRPIRDLDLAVEGDAIRLAQRLASELHVEPRVHDRFGTATLKFPNGRRLDLATSRREIYDRPGALPRVEPASIEEDLARRDFTINAMAVEVAPGPPRLLDLVNGRRDLAKRRVRMLHARSPFDDPTRAFRAVRYANRLGFEIEPRTRGWIRKAIARRCLDAVSGERLRGELELLFGEARRAEAVRAMGSLSLERAVHPALRADEPLLARIRRAERYAARRPAEVTWFLFLLVWSADLTPQDAKVLAHRLALRRDAAHRLLSWPDALAFLTRDRSALAPSRVVKLGLSSEEMLAAESVLPARTGRALERAIDALAITLEITGRHLLDRGLRAGPRIGRALAATLSARQDGMISREEELEFAMEAARGERL